MQGKIVDTYLSYIPLFFLLLGYLPDKVALIVEFILDSALYRVRGFHVCLFLLEALGI